MSAHIVEFVTPIPASANPGEYIDFSVRISNIGSVARWIGMQINGEQHGYGFLQPGASAVFMPSDPYAYRMGTSNLVFAVSAVSGGTNANILEPFVVNETQTFTVVSGSGTPSAFAHIMNDASSPILPPTAQPGDTIQASVRLKNIGNIAANLGFDLGGSYLNGRTYSPVSPNVEVTVLGTPFSMPSNPFGMRVTSKHQLASGSWMIDEEANVFVTPGPTSYPYTSIVSATFIPSSGATPGSMVTATVVVKNTGQSSGRLAIKINDGTLTPYTSNLVAPNVTTTITTSFICPDPQQGWSNDPSEVGKGLVAIQGYAETDLIQSIRGELKLFYIGGLLLPRMSIVEKYPNLADTGTSVVLNITVKNTGDASGLAEVEVKEMMVGADGESVSSIVNPNGLQFSFSLNPRTILKGGTAVFSSAPFIMPDRKLPLRIWAYTRYSTGAMSNSTWADHIIRREDAPPPVNVEGYVEVVEWGVVVDGVEYSNGEVPLSGSGHRLFVKVKNNCDRPIWLQEFSWKLKDSSNVVLTEEVIDLPPSDAHFLGDPIDDCVAWGITMLGVGDSMKYTSLDTFNPTNLGIAEFSGYMKAIADCKPGWFPLPGSTIIIQTIYERMFLYTTLFTNDATPPGEIVNDETEIEFLELGFVKDEDGKLTIYDQGDIVEIDPAAKYRVHFKVENKSSTGLRMWIRGNVVDEVGDTIGAIEAYSPTEPVPTDGVFEGIVPSDNYGLRLKATGTYSFMGSIYTKTSAAPSWSKTRDFSYPLHALCKDDPEKKAEDMMMMMMMMMMMSMMAPMMKGMGDDGSSSEMTDTI